MTPAQSQVLTCDSLQLTATGGSASDTVLWSVPSGPGAVSAGGLYTAPTQAAGAVSVDVRATDTTHQATADAMLDVATAFPGAPVALTGGANTSAHSFAHAAAANGSRVYAVVAGPSSLTPTTLIQRSDDSGATWNAPVAAITATLAGTEAEQMDCMAVAVDPVNPDLVYVYAFQQDQTAEGNAVAGAPSGDTAFLAVSKDGARTFTQMVMRVNADELCGDIAAPQANTIVVVAPEGGFSNEAEGEFNQDAVVWLDAQAGAGFATGMQVSPTGHPDYSANGETHALDDILTDNTGTHALEISGSAPHLLTDGAGHLCFTYAGNLHANNSGERGVYVQCSANLGMTFSSPLLVSTSSSYVAASPAGALSSGGNVAIFWATGGNAASGNFLAVSTNGGTSFAAPVATEAYTLPSSSSTLYGGEPTAIYEGADILWLASDAYVGNGVEPLVVDKTCDNGKTFSGITLANGPAASIVNMRSPTLVMTAAGPRLIALIDSSSAPNLAAINLGP